MGFSFFQTFLKQTLYFCTSRQYLFKATMLSLGIIISQSRRQWLIRFLPRRTHCQYTYPFNITWQGSYHQVFYADKHKANTSIYYIYIQSMYTCVCYSSSGLVSVITVANTAESVHEEHWLMQLDSCHTAWRVELIPTWVSQNWTEGNVGDLKDHV